MEKKNIYVDGWCSVNPGRGGWKVILNDKTIYVREIDKTTNNLCEYFAIIDAIYWMNKSGEYDWTIWSDSMTALSWIKNKRVKTTFKDEKILRLVSRSEAFLKDLKWTPIIKKWMTDVRGENPADFGRKPKKRKPLNSEKKKVNLRKEMFESRRQQQSFNDFGL